MIAPLTEPFLTSDRDVRTTSVIGASTPNHSRIGTPFMNKDISSGYNVLSTVRSDISKAEKLNTAVQKSSTDKSNTAPSRIEEGSPKSTFTEIFEESNSSERVNLANSLGVHTPKLVSFRHPPMQTYNVGHQSNGSVADRVVDQDRILRPTDREVRTTPTHGEIETISEKLAYRKFIMDSEIETREVFEREIIENIGTRLETNRLDDQMNRSVDSSKCSKKHEPEVNLDPDLSSSNSSDSSSSDSAPQKQIKKKKSVVSIGKMTRPTHIQAMILIRPMTVITDVNDLKIRNIRKIIRSDYAQL